MQATNWIFGLKRTDRSNRGGYGSTLQNILLSMVLLTILMVVTEELLNYSVMEHQLELRYLDQRERLMLELMVLQHSSYFTNATAI